MRRLAVLFVLLAVTTARAAADEWRTYTNCTLLPNKYNDGDSFHVNINGREKILRLYFVDAPETDERFPDRVAEQAAYFGITSRQTIELGKKAALFTTETLSQKPFTVTTRGQDAEGASGLPREYAIVTVGTNDLADLLVANRLARVHGLSVPDIGKKRFEKLHDLEKKANKKPRS